MIKFRKPKRHLSEISVTCFVCGEVYLNKFEPKYKFTEDAASSWKCPTCAKEFLKNHEFHMSEDEAKELGYFYCFACHKKFDLKNQDYPCCIDCYSKMWEQNDMLIKLNDLRDLNMDKKL